MPAAVARQPPYSAQGLRDFAVTLTDRNPTVSEAITPVLRAADGPPLMLLRYCAIRASGGLALSELGCFPRVTFAVESAPRRAGWNPETGTSRNSCRSGAQETGWPKASYSGW